MNRKPLSTRARAELFAACCGTCHLCGGPILVGDTWDVSHPIPLALGGADDATNRDIAHRKCHRLHTAGKDAPAIAEAKRREALHRGWKAPSCRPMPCGRNSPYRKHIDGRVSRRWET